MSSDLSIELPRTVDVGAIDHELRSLWREASADTAHPVARACMLSLVIFVDAPDLSATADMAAELAVHHPSRTILVAVDPDAASGGLSAEVAARCHVSFGRRQQICSEQVIIKANGRSIEEVHGVVIPLLTSDLPSFLWWRSSKWPEGPSFKNIAAGCDRVIVDSSVLTDSAASFRRLAELVVGQPRAQASRYSVADLNWSRLTPWRIALAELYDLPAYRQYLVKARRFSITYSPRLPQGAADNASNNQSVSADTIPAGALLLAGWLASRLGWGKPHPVERTGGGFSFGFTRAGHDIELVLSPSPGEGRPGGVSATPSGDGSQITGGTVLELKIETNSDPVTSFFIGMIEGCIETKMVLEGEAQAPRIVGRSPEKDPDLVGEELDILGHDTTYEGAVSAGADIAGAIG
jgi:glucose-6-phosphate dehydrogenase assembly protein OpcA